MTRTRAIALAVAFVGSLCPATATPQNTSLQPAPDLWLAPSGRPSAATAAMAEAVRQLDAGKAAAALPVFSKYVSDPLIGGYALLLQGRAQLELKQIKPARFSAEQLAKVEPVDYLKEAALVLAADVAEAEGDSDAEFRALQAAALLKPVAGAPLFLRLGRAAKAAGDLSAARGAFNTVIYQFATSPEANAAIDERAALDPGAVPTRDTAEADLGRGEQLYASKRYTDAKAAFAAVKPVAVGAEKDQIAVRIAQCDVALGKYKDAKNALTPLLAGERALPATSPWAFEARFARLLALRGLGEDAAYVAEARAMAGLTDQPRWAEAALNDLATYYILEDEDPKAADVFAEMWRRYPSGANGERAAWRWGWWSFTHGDYAETVRVFDDAFERFPRSDYRSAWVYWSARAQQQLGQRAVAEQGYRQTIALYQNSYYGREAIKSLGALTESPSRPPVARAGRAALPPLSPGQPPANARLISRLLEIGLYDDAIGELKRAERDAGGSPLLTATMAYAWNRKGELRTAITLMKRAYPQFMAAGGETLPVDIRRVIFPMAYWELIQKYANAHRLDPHLIAALITQESTFDKDIRSGANAWGLMQILPSTGKSYARKLGIKAWRVSKLTDAEINVRIGTAYFADLVQRYDGIVGALIAYNAGGSRYRRWVVEYPGATRDEFIDNIPFFETQNYLKRILGTADDFRALYPLTISRRGH